MGLVLLDVLIVASSGSDALYRMLADTRTFRIVRLLRLMRIIRGGRLGVNLTASKSETAVSWTLPTRYQNIDAHTVCQSQSKNKHELLHHDLIDHPFILECLFPTAISSFPLIPHCCPFPSSYFSSS
jgi:hypothetical protein